MSSKPRPLIKARSRSVALPLSGSVLLSVASDTIKGHANLKGLGHYLGPCWYLRATLPRGHANLGDLCCLMGSW